MSETRTSIKRKDLILEDDSSHIKKIKSEEIPKEISLLNHENFSQLESRLKKSPAGRQWAKIGIRHHFGVNVPIFSLKTSSSCGTGEYLDLLPLIDWCKSNKFDVIQTLPLNDTNPSDNSPFSPISSFSLNPRLISIKSLPNYDMQTEKMKELVEKLSDLNSKDRVQWNEVNDLKMKWLWEYFNQKDQQDTLQSQEFKDYIHDNKSWLEPYGIFCLLKRITSWKHWKDWEESSELEKNPFKDSIMELSFAQNLMKPSKDQDDSTLGKNNRRECDFYMFLQFLCSKQMKKAREYAESNKVFLKGDIPFLVSGDSVDVWLNRKFFHLERTAGAPPDMYAADGQNWGVPIYNWDAIKADNWTWWKNRLETANQYFHLFRIDHVVGFFRVWAIPLGKKGTDGVFEPTDEKKWIPQGEEIMRMILENCDMLPIGEDLGSVPSSVRSCLQRLGICGTKVVRWERNWDRDGKPFIPYEDYNADSMTTVSTHDSETVTQWWMNCEEDVVAYEKFSGIKRNEEKMLLTEHRKQILKESHNTPSLFHISLINEYLSLVPELAHKDPELERVNLPGQVSDSNWSYRMLPLLEKVAQNERLNSYLKEINQPPLYENKISQQASTPEKDIN